MLVTGLLGASLYLIKDRFPFVVIAWVLWTVLTLSLLFQVGEVYFYHDFYARVFFIFGDSIPTVIAFFCLYAVAKNKSNLVYISFIALFITGGKATFLLLILMLLQYSYWANKRSLKFHISVIKYFVVGFLISLLLISLSRLIENTTYQKAIAETSNSHLINAGFLDANKLSSNHHGACPSLEVCAETQLINALKQRYYSSIGGAWMTTQGGYKGQLYPNTPDKFAALMMAANPWGVNDRYGLNYEDWKKIGQIQNAYLNFGSGYGPWMLGVLIFILSIGCYMAVSNLKYGEGPEGIAISVFFLVNIIFNHSQSWLHSGSLILILLGFCAAHIVYFWTLREKSSVY